MSSVLSRIEIRPLHPLFVAEVTGVDLTVPVSREDLAAIWEAFNEHQVIVFRDQTFDDETQMAFSRNFGALETMEAHAANNYQPGHIAVMTNVDAQGNLLPLDHKIILHRQRNENWHTDSSFKHVPALASLLSGRLVPPVGGNTEFASARAAYAALPPQRRAAVDGLVVKHQVGMPKDEKDRVHYTDEQRQRLSPTHPLVRTNPVNGRKNLYVGSHAGEVLGMGREEGGALIDELTAFCTQPQFVYSHQWRVHDAVMWDNRCVLHRATTFDKTKYRRVMHRTTVAGRAPDSVLAQLPEASAV